MNDDVRSRMIAFLPRLRRFAFALTGSLDQADDLVQDTCERALTRLAQWQPGTRLDSWMYRIAQNLWLDRGRARLARGQTEQIDVAIDIVGADGRAVTESRLTLAFVTERIGKLPPDQQVLIALVCVEGLSYRDAADVLELPIGTVMSRLARARQSLHAAMGEKPDHSKSQPFVEPRRGQGT